MSAVTFTNTDEERQARFQRALDLVITPAERERHGIGMQMEKTLHAVLKAYEDPDEDHQEIPLEDYIADIYNENGVTEIQTAGFDRLRNKLQRFLPLYPVTVVYPIPAQKWVIWIDPETGLIEKKNRSPQKGTYCHAFRELYKISPFLADPNLTIKLILLDLEEYRLRDGWSRDGKRGSHRYDRIPVRVAGETVLREPRDYLQFIPFDIEEPFTAKELARKAGYARSERNVSAVPLVLCRLGVLERAGKRGRANLYRVPEELV